MPPPTTTTPTTTTSPKKLRVGILGAGLVAQTIHLPTLTNLHTHYTIHSLHDISPALTSHSATLYHIPRTPSTAQELINDPDVDVIFILTPDEYHEPYALLALAAGKDVLLEKPLSLSVASGLRILAAERSAASRAPGVRGPRVFVGYMRRYAHSFVGAFQRECRSLRRILYARCRGIVGPNEFFVGQGGMFPKGGVPLILPPAEGGSGSGKGDGGGVEEENEGKRLLDGLLREAFEGKDVTAERMAYCRFLGSLGSHDLSVMREVLGLPSAVTAVSARAPFHTAMFEYDDHPGGKFTCTYESGIDNVPRFDSGLTVYGEDKTVSIVYDTPFVKGLPIKVKVEEKNEFGEMVERVICSSYEDAFTAELVEMHKCFTEGKEIKTSVEDAVEDLKLFRMMFERYERQLEGT